jgi:hypothetical protein
MNWKNVEVVMEYLEGTAKKCEMLQSGQLVSKLKFEH